MNIEDIWHVGVKWIELARDVAQWRVPQESGEFPVSFSRGKSLFRGKSGQRMEPLSREEFDRTGRVFADQLTKSAAAEGIRK